MSLPETYTLIRHGLSEANVVQAAFRAQTDITLPEEFFTRHDSNMRLALQGVEQAIATGVWLKENNFLFDRFYVSPHTRTRETAYNLHLGGQWRVDDRFRERDWGEIKTVSSTREDPQTPASRMNKQLSEWYWKPQAGESLATGVRLRAESITNSLYRKSGSSHAVAVTHGEFIRATQFVIERMTPEAWGVMNDDPAYKVQNCMVIQYSRRNPNNESEAFSNHYVWRRAICPWDETRSWDNGEWVYVNATKFSDDDLKASVENYKRLL